MRRGFQLSIALCNTLGEVCKASLMLQAFDGLDGIIHVASRMKRGFQLSIALCSTLGEVCKASLMLQF
jgi:hypothetical protein